MWLALYSVLSEEPKVVWRWHGMMTPELVIWTGSEESIFYIMAPVMVDVYDGSTVAKAYRYIVVDSVAKIGTLF